MKNVTFVLFVAALVVLGGCSTNPETRQVAENPPVMAAVPAESKSDLPAFNRDGTMKSLRSMADFTRTVDWNYEVKGKALCHLRARHTKLEELRLRLRETAEEIKRRNLTEIQPNEFGFANQGEFEKYASGLDEEYLQTLVAVFGNSTKTVCDGMLIDKYEIMNEIARVLHGKDAGYLSKHGLAPARQRQMWLAAFKEMVVGWRKDGSEYNDRSVIISGALGEYNFTPAELGLTQAEVKKLEPKGHGG